MIKKIFFLAFICALVGCQKETVQLNNNKKELVSSNKLSNSSDHRDLPSEVRDIIANGGDGHFDCEITTNRESAEVGLFGGFSSGSSLGAYAYAYTLDMGLLKLPNSSLPCQPNIPYFIFGYINEQDDILSTEYSLTFHLVLNPSYNNVVKVVDTDWDLNGQNGSISVGSFTIDDLRIGEPNSVTCRVFSTENNATVYSQEMVMDFELLLNLGGGDPVVEYGPGYTFACPAGGTFPIFAP